MWRINPLANGQCLASYCARFSIILYVTGLSSFGLASARGRGNGSKYQACEAPVGPFRFGDLTPFPLFNVDAALVLLLAHFRREARQCKLVFLHCTGITGPGNDFRRPATESDAYPCQDAASHSNSKARRPVAVTDRSLVGRFFSK